MRVAAVVPAAGCGARFGGSTPKQYLAVAGLPLLAWTLRALLDSKVVESLTVVVAPGEEGRCRAEVLTPHAIPVAHIVAGGADRQASVWAGVQAVGGAAELILVHDGARPLIPAETIRAAVEIAARDGAAVVAAPVSDTIKVAGPDRVVRDTPRREELWAAQTPQVFRADWLRAAHLKAQADGFRGTDDSVLVERLGHPVRLVPCTAPNIKVTTPTDLTQAEHVLRSRAGSSA